MEMCTTQACAHFFFQRLGNESVLAISYV